MLLKQLFFTVLFYCSWLSCLSGFAQAPNDNFEDRLKLQVNRPVTSTTVGCTVQKNCVDEKLTGKCVEYHNDQWFEFTPEKSSTYYINISEQDCRDVRGVQLVVFTGTPCQTETYQILSCTSLGSHDDVFVPLLNSKAGTTYYLNVDGYLHDFCTFRLEISNQAKGIPANTLPLIPAVSSQKSVAIYWTLPDSVSAGSFSVFRRRADQNRSEILAKIPVNRNAYGHLDTAYHYSDTLTVAGSYFYQVLADGTPTGEPTLLKKLAYHWRPANTRKYVILSLQEFPDKAVLTIIASDPTTGSVLRRSQLIKQKEPGMQAIYMLPYTDLEPGRKIRVTIQFNRKKSTVSRDYLLTLEGKAN